MFRCYVVQLSGSPVSSINELSPLELWTSHAFCEKAMLGTYLLRHSCCSLPAQNTRAAPSTHWIQKVAKVNIFILHHS